MAYLQCIYYEFSIQRVIYSSGQVLIKLLFWNQERKYIF
jgi:hypothetical protein